MVDESLPIPVRDRLLALAPDQRAAAMAPPGPVLCVAPAGSGKTTTLVARIAWRIATGADPAAVTAIAFNRRAAIELAERLTGALGPLGVPAGTVLVRTFHALGLEILREAGRKVRIADRDAILRIVRPHASAAERAWLDTCVSRLKIEHGTTPAAIAADPDPGDVGRAFLDYQAEVDARGAFDFDDLLIEALRVLRADPVLLDQWQARCVDLLVDEAQDLDRVQLELALLLSGAPPAIFLVGDDDQSIYGWRLADVRRLLAVAADTPGLVRVDLEVNYRCPAPVVERAGRLVSVNQERLVKRVRPRAGATGWLALVRDGRVDHLRLRDVVARLPGADGTQAVLARTNRELLPAILVAVELDRPFRSELTLPVEAPWVDHVLSRLEQEDHDGPLLVVLDRVLRSLMHGSDPGLEPAPGEVDEVDGAAPDLGWESPPAPASGEPTGRREEDPGATWPPGSIARALLGWAAGARDATSLARAVGHIQDRLRALRRPDASLVLSTAHATKGLEFDDVVVIMDRGRFPSPRSIHATTEPQRALEEERRLAYVAWTRARRSLTLIYDPAAPSLFLGEAFSAAELGVDVTQLARGPPLAIPHPVGGLVPPVPAILARCRGRRANDTQKSRSRHGRVIGRSHPPPIVTPSWPSRRDGVDRPSRSIEEGIVMRRLTTAIVGAALASALAVGTVAAGGPPHVGFYVDGAPYRTIGTPTDFSGTGAPAHSYDRIFVLGGDLMNVAEAKPGDRDFNGGRWMVIPVDWQDTTPTQLTSADDLIALEAAGLVSFGDPVKYFECPVIPLPGNQR